MRTDKKESSRPAPPSGPGIRSEIERLRAENARLSEALHASEAKFSSAEAELRALAQHILDVREDERKSVARELHDELGQALTAIEMELRAMARARKDLGEAQRKRLGELLFTTNQTIRSVQRLCSELRPAVLDRLGLQAAIEWLAEDTSSRCALIASSKVGIREAAIGPRASIALFRITQETLTNVVRHAKASSFAIELQDTGQAVRLLVRDDGVGISEAEATAPGSFGILGIRERARSLGGSVTLRGEAGRGTTLEVSIPFPADGRLP
jgi:signal transduction histidine kinase